MAMPHVPTPPARTRSAASLSPLARVVLAFVLVAGLGAAEAKKKDKTSQELISKAIKPHRSEIENCASYAMDSGAQSVNIDAQLTIDSNGTLVNAAIAVRLDRTNATTEVKACVEAVLATVSFPAIPDPIFVYGENWQVLRR